LVVNQDAAKKDGTMKFRKSDTFIIREIDGESVLLNGQTGDYYGLKEVGTDFIKLVDGKRDMDEIIGALLLMYDIDEATLRNDIEELAEKMIGTGILIRNKKDE
jgi:hypothetical protein